MSHDIPPLIGAPIVSSKSESDTEDVRSRKVYTTPLARAKGKTFFQCYLLLCARSTLHAEQDSTHETAYGGFQLDLICHGYGARYAHTVDTQSR